MLPQCLEVSKTGVRKHTLLASAKKDTGELNQILSEAVNRGARPDMLPLAVNPASDENGSASMLPEEKDENYKLRPNHKGLGNMLLLAFENKNLKYLLLHSNEIKTLHSNIGNLTNLEILLLERNRLTLVPPEISLRHQLTVLNVSHN